MDTPSSSLASLGTVHLELKHFSRFLKTYCEKPFFAEPIVLQHVKWTVGAYVTTKKENDELIIYVHGQPQKEISNNLKHWHSRCTFGVKVISHLDPKVHKSTGCFTETFSTKSPQFGYDGLITIPDIMGKNNEFRKNNTVLVEVEIAAEPPRFY